MKEKGPLAAGLYILATPIGNARDVSLRALEVLKGCDVIAAEDTRVTSKLLSIHGISRPLIPYNDHNGGEMRPKILARLEQGQAVALVSDAGTPLVSDPGYKLVREVIAAGANIVAIPGPSAVLAGLTLSGLPSDRFLFAGANIVAIPGPSAVLAGLTLSGLPSDRFLFAGFLSSRAGERKTVLEELKGVRATLVFFESAQRLSESLTAMADVLGDRACAMTRELTKLHEEVRRGSLRELAAHYEKAGAPKGEVTLLVGPPLEAVVDDAKVDAALRAALAFMPVKAAAEMIAALTDGSRKQLYAKALELRALELKDDAKN